MIAEIRRIGAALGLSDGGLLQLARDIAHDGALLTVAHLRRQHQEQLLAFLREIAVAEAAERERFDRVLV